MATSTFGVPTPRVDGRAKVTGEAKYAAEFKTPDLAYGFVVGSTIAKGRIRRIDTSEALAVEGVLDVFTHAATIFASAYSFACGLMLFGFPFATAGA